MRGHWRGSILLFGWMGAVSLHCPLVSEAAVEFTTNAVIAADDLTYEGQDIVVRGALFVIQGAHRLGAMEVGAGSLVRQEGTNLDVHSLSVSNAVFDLWGRTELSASNSIALFTNSTVQCLSTNVEDPVGGQWIGRGVTIHASNATVNAGGRIIAHGQGYAGMRDQGHQWGIGPGASAPLNGGSYGGRGSSGSPGGGIGEAYGSALEPVALGSSGGSWESRLSGAGGGAIRLNVLGSLTLDGSIGANGAEGQEHSGGGAGGSVWVTAHTLTGAGRFEARGDCFSEGAYGDRASFNQQ